MAPLVASLLSSGLSLLGNAVLEKGKDYVEKKLGIELPDENSSVSPEKLAELRQLEFDHEEALLAMAIRRAEISLEEYKAGLASDSDARNMQNNALKQDDLFSKRFIYYFAIVWCGFAALYITAITFIEIPKESIRFADTILGFLLGTVISQIVAFFFGSSHRSAKKDETIAALSGGMK